MHLRFLVWLVLAFPLLGMGQVNSFPDLEDFEGEIVCPASCAPLCSLLGKWDNAIHIGLPPANLNWSSNAGPTTSSNTGPSNDHTLQNANGHYVFLESSCTNIGFPNKTGFLVGPWYDLRNTNVLAIDFWYHMRGSTMGSLHLDVDTTGNGIWVQDVVPAWTGNDTAWLNKLVRLDQFTGRDSVRIRIRGITGSGFDSDMAVDDIEVFIPPGKDFSAVSFDNPPRAGCGLGNDSIRVTYKYLGTDTLFPGDTLIWAYQVDTFPEVREFSLSPDTLLFCDTFHYAFQTPFLFLAPQNYLVTVWSELPGDSLRRSNDTLTQAILSLPAVNAFPYAEDFELGTGGWQSGGVNNTWAFGNISKTVITAPASGQAGWVTGGLGPGDYANNENSWVESPCFDFSGICNPWLELKIWYDAETSWDGANITYSTDAGQSWNLLGAFQDPYNWYNDNSINGEPGDYLEGWTGTGSAGSGGWVTARHALAPAAGRGNIIFRVNMGADGVVTEEGIAFDDIKIYDGLSLQPDTLICSPDSFLLTAQGEPGDSWMWSTGDTTQAIWVTQSGNYSVMLDHNGCLATDSVYVLALDANNGPELGPDTVACGPVLVLDPGYFPGASYLWSNGDTSRTGRVTSSGVTSVQVITSCDTLSDSVQVSLSLPPAPNLGADTSACNALTLYSGITGFDQTWSTGDTTGFLTVNQTGVYSVEVEDSLGCVAADTIQIVIYPHVPVDLGPDSTFCEGDTFCLGPLQPQAGTSYLWSTGASSTNICITEGGIFALSSLDTNGCNSRDTVRIQKVNLPNPFFTFSPAPGNGLTMDFTDLSTGAPFQWLWDFGDGGGSILQNPTHTYTNPGVYTVVLSVTNACGLVRDSGAILITGLNPGWDEQPVEIFPMPTSEEFFIRFPKDWKGLTELILVNAEGKTVLQQQLSLDSENHPFKVLTENLSAGLYFLIVKNFQKIHSSKILIIKE